MRPQSRRAPYDQPVRDRRWPAQYQAASPQGCPLSAPRAAPFLVYGTGVIRRVEELRRDLPDDTHLRSLRGQGQSGGRRGTARQQAGRRRRCRTGRRDGRRPEPPIPVDRVSFPGSGKTPAQLPRPMSARGTISFDSEDVCLRRAEVGGLWRSFSADTADDAGPPDPPPSGIDITLHVDRRSPSVHDQ